ncbi:MAG: bifunctional proline dehydrogenase/L-glutamate gamma-semialdehyde dehydrogenase PutA [Gammaproteobacteria bacterium]|nr:bifunctional proline dehydrogenase/L-glutamate gamma-semialdehyde dehydrogenase PutA [Gammaproteobacteria bacterium]
MPIVPPADNANPGNLRESIRTLSHADEARCAAQLVASAESCLDSNSRRRVLEQATALVERCRAARDQAGTLDAFLQEFGLSNREGVALMCLAEALLRIPDEATADKLIAEKIRSGDWGAHIGKSSSRFVNASVWGLMLTGRLVTLEPEVLEDTGAWMRHLVSRVGEPVVRTAVLQAMRIMGGQYVLGRTIDEAKRRGESGNEPGTRFSFDMLGEGARTRADAERYFQSYVDAITAIGQASQHRDPILGDGISVKLSALHPRYEYAQRELVLSELGGRLKELALAAKKYQMGFSIDAEEAGRLELSLDLFESLARDPELAAWNGLGFVLQAYQKRAPAVADWLIALARDSGRQFMVRLVKGAYWDTEIKHAQEQGLRDYPVFTRKANTDLCFEVCATRLLAAPDAVFAQFATHNAYTARVVLELAGSNKFEFQRLHGMGHLLYAELAKIDPSEPLSLRVYAPVGSHRDLLPYLVRRLLENGANTSFVNRFLDARVPVSDLLQDSLHLVKSQVNARHPEIPPPPEMYRYSGEARKNAAGLDLDNPPEVATFLAARRSAAVEVYLAGPIVNGELRDGQRCAVLNPADGRHQVGEVIEATAADIDAALESAASTQEDWDHRGGEQRAEILERAAGLLETRYASLTGLITAEAGRTVADALSEVREAVDFCRYYALQARMRFAKPHRLPGPTGEINELSLHGRGVFACISPWNFPLAIFMGQAAAALAAGNSVIAKPAEQTPLVAACAVRLLHDAGVPSEVLHLLPGDGGRVGGALVGNKAIGGVAFTGSTETARSINCQLAERDGAIVPLIAETGGQNVMLVDSTALPEQVVDDVIASAFFSAGQRCSALRVLYLQEEIAEDVLKMLRGAMASLVIGDPLELTTDIGPVIDEQALTVLENHTKTMTRTAKLIAQCDLPRNLSAGNFFAPRVFEIDSINQLQREVFGPLLHVVRYNANNLDSVIDEINATGYGLTLGIHSRLDGFAREVFDKTHVGNTYINRNMIGAVVGVNPFGGQGLSGTGPKAGGPNYLPRFAVERTRTDNVVAKGGNTELFALRQ